MANPSTRDSSFGTTESGNPLLQMFDGSGRLPRPTQVKALDWIHDNFDSSPSPLVIEAGVGCGKTALLRAAQLQYGGSIATSQNTLVSQYQSDYPNLNVIIGMQHYRCSQYLTRCGYASQRYNCRGGRGIDGVDSPCKMRMVRERFASGTPTLFNTMSLYVTRKRGGLPTETTYVDEAHQLISVARQASTYSNRLYAADRTLLRKMNMTVRSLRSEINLCKFFDAKLESLEKKLARKLKVDETEAILSAIQQTEFTRECFVTEPEKYVIDTTENSLLVTPIVTPRTFLKRIIEKKGILTSATLLPHDVREILGRKDYPFIDLGTSIPKENRRVIWSPSKFSHRAADIDIPALAQRIEDIYKSTGKKNTLVHVTYSLMLKLLPYMRTPVIWHDETNKAEAIEQFLTNGGIMLGAGMSEGLDLKGDLCRTQIITTLQFPNIMDPWVSKRKALPDGEEWMIGEVMKVLRQQIGRGTRGENDYCENYVLDNRFATVINKARKLGMCPGHFFESIEGWNS
jgi:ATP-dependent DNA helicase DinG